MDLRACIVLTIELNENYSILEIYPF